MPPDVIFNESSPFDPGVGQVVLPPVSIEDAPADQVQSLYRLSDPALSELGLEQLLDQLLVRTRDALEVDTVAILLLDEEAPQLVARAAKGIEEEVEQDVRIPIGKGFAGRIAAERVAIFIADVDHADILNPILREKGIRSLLGVPLIVEGGLIGVLHVGSLTPRTFGERDLAILQVAASRAAPAIERARLFSALEHEHRVAVVLQRSLLPKRPVDVVGISVASRYLPARDEVGGDWYDVFELPHGRIGVAIGDVVGHGIRAAALMGQLRTALHAYAIQGHGPGRTLELVDRFVHLMADEAMATAAYAVLDPETGQVRFASAGHLPPIVAGAGRARVIETEPVAPLGAFPYGSSTEHELSLAGGEMLVLYTDGLIERAGAPLDGSIDQLIEILSDASSPESACELAIDQLVPLEGLRDDAAIVAVENGDVPDELVLRLRADANELSRMRRGMRRWLRSKGAGDRDLNEITIAVNEACANAIEHAYSPSPARFTLEASERDGVVTILVIDQGVWREPRGRARGRGLTIVRTAMDDVEVLADDRGTTVWMRRRLGAR